MARQKKEKPDWYPLDNAGVLYASIQKERYSAIYRFSAVMTQEVDPAALQRAVDKVMPRFPGFRVRIKQGLFWYYLEPNDAPGQGGDGGRLFPLRGEQGAPGRLAEDGLCQHQ